VKKSFLLSVALSFVLLTSSASVFATTNVNPAGSNGFVKINNEIAPDQIPQNHPHVNCTFDVEFYNYDKNNNNAKVKFELQAPTATDQHSLKVASGNLNPFIGGDSAGGGTDLDARESYRLKFTGNPQDNQGYHVKLTVEAPGSKGNDKKYKVFWVEPCKETTNPNTEDTESNEDTNDVLGDQTPSELPQTGPALPGVLGLGTLATIIGYAVSNLRQKRF